MTATVLLSKLQRMSSGKRRGRSVVDGHVFGTKLGLAARLFGCWHEDVGRPFVRGKSAYRTCLKCGARRQFDPATLVTFGSFYSAPVER